MRYMLISVLGNIISTEMFCNKSDACKAMNDEFNDKAKQLSLEDLEGNSAREEMYSWFINPHSNLMRSWRVVEVKDKEDEKYIVYTEIHNPNGAIERWYYGTFSKDRANDVAEQLGTKIDDFGVRIYHCVCKADLVDCFDIQNLPNK